MAAWVGLLCCCGGLPTQKCWAADLQEIVRQAAATLRSDWGEDEVYAHVERKEIQKSGKLTSETSQVIYIGGSDYSLPLAINDLRLAPDRERAELEKLRQEVQRRNGESPETRRKRIEAFRKEREENATLVRELPKAFNFELLREETINGRAAFVLYATPNKRSDAGMSKVAKVLSGMYGTIWVDKENFHALRVECEVVTPIPMYGSLVQVLPGTRIELGLAPVTDSLWRIGRLSITLTVSKFFWFKSTEATRSTYSDYRLNDPFVDELLLESKRTQTLNPKTAVSDSKVLVSQPTR